MILTEQNQLRKSTCLSRLCHHSKNLYNEANYIIRQRFFKDRHWIRYTQLNRLLKTSNNYTALPSQSSQQTLRTLDKSWRSFFQAIRDWRQHPQKYHSRPKIPGYKRKNGEFPVFFTNQQCRIRHGYLLFPKRVNLPPIKTNVIDCLHQVRIIPNSERYILEVIYHREPSNMGLEQNRIIGIDLGLCNLVTIVNNIGSSPIIIKGGIVKSINQFYNKQLAKYRAIKNRQGYRFTTKYLRRLSLKRRNKLYDVFHKVSRFIVNFCVKHNVGTIVLGYNPLWKQKINLGKRGNQQFVQVPFTRLIHMICYKAELLGISVRITDEMYTSKCSFLDEESLKHHESYKGRRIKRGLFRSEKGELINADVNGAYNIIRKAFPKAFLADGIEALGLVPQSRLII